MNWAMEQATGDPRAQCLLYVIADCANEEGVAWPGADWMAEKSQQSRATVYRRLDALQALGVLSMRPRWTDDHGKIWFEPATGRWRTSPEIRLHFGVFIKQNLSADDDPETPKSAPPMSQAETTPVSPVRQGSSQCSDTVVSPVRQGSSHCCDNNHHLNQIDIGGDARARDGSVFTEGSKALASVFWKALGIESPLQIPPELSGVDYRATMWEREGWPPDMIDAETRKFATDRPFKPISYFEKVFATAFARRQAPLPVVEVRQAEKLTVKRYGTASQGSGIIQAADRLNAIIDGFDDGPSGEGPGRAEELCRQAGETPVRMLPQR